MLPYILQAEKLSVSQAHNLKTNNGDYVTLLLLFFVLCPVLGSLTFERVKTRKEIRAGGGEEDTMDCIIVCKFMAVKILNRRQEARGNEECNDGGQ